MCQRTQPSELSETYKGVDWMGWAMPVFSKKPAKLKIMFVDEMNDLQSQIAEYFLNEMYGDLYEATSSGPKWDCIDCELISSMYQLGYDIRACSAKDFKSKKLPKKPDYIVFLEKATYDRIKDIIPWDSKQILKDFGRKAGFEKATDDLELFHCYCDLVEEVRVWVRDTFKDPASLESLVA